MKKTANDILFYVNNDEAEWPAVHFVTKKYWETNYSMDDELPKWAATIVEKFTTLHQMGDQDHCRYDMVYEYDEMKEKLLSYGFSQSENFDTFMASFN